MGAEHATCGYVTGVHEALVAWIPVSKADLGTFAFFPMIRVRNRFIHPVPSASAVSPPLLTHLFSPLGNAFQSGPTKSCPQGLKPVSFASCMYGLKPVPFTDSHAEAIMGCLFRLFLSGSPTRSRSRRLQGIRFSVRSPGAWLTDRGVRRAGYAFAPAGNHRATRRNSTTIRSSSYSA